MSDSYKALPRGTPPAQLHGSSVLSERGSRKRGPISKAEAQAKQESKPSRTTPPRAVVPSSHVRPMHRRSPAVQKDTARRRFLLRLLFGSGLATGFSALTVSLSAMLLAAARFMFPNVLVEPPTRFKVGHPADFPTGTVDTRFKDEFGVWIVNAQYNSVQQVYALVSVCTHMGCTPNWLEGDKKFKCPCHGSGFYQDGVNFEGPAPRPLERCLVRIASDGQIEVDKSATFREELGQWNDSDSFISV